MRNYSSKKCLGYLQKLIIPSLVYLLLADSVLAQTSFEDEIARTYPENFEKAVTAKSFDLLTALYTDQNAKLNVVKKHKSGASPYFNSDAAGWGNSLPGIGGVYELRISDAEYFRLKGMAISQARFDEYINDKHFADGYDLFTYILTEEGWRINHMDVSLASENDLPEKVDKLMNESGFNALLDVLKSSLTKNTVSDTLFYTNNGGLYLNTFKNGMLNNTIKLKIGEWNKFVDGKNLYTNNLNTGFIDGHLAYVYGALNDHTDLIATLINANDQWKISSINISKY